MWPVGQKVQAIVVTAPQGHSPRSMRPMPVGKRLFFSISSITLWDSESIMAILSLLLLLTSLLHVLGDIQKSCLLIQEKPGKLSSTK